MNAVISDIPAFYDKTAYFPKNDALHRTRGDIFERRARPLVHLSYLTKQRDLYA